MQKIDPFPGPVSLVCLVELEDLGVAFQFEGAEIERDVVWGGEAVSFAVSQRLGDGGEVPGDLLGDASEGWSIYNKVYDL